MQAAAELFAVKGFRATTVRDIAEEAGILSGSLYAHIETKEKLYLEIVHRAAVDFSNAVEPIVVNASQDPAAKLREMVQAHLTVIGDSRAWAQVYLDDNAALSGEARAQARGLCRQYERLWDQVLDDGLRLGVFRVSDESLARLFILSALNGVIRWYNPAGRLSPDAIGSAFAAMILRLLEAVDTASWGPHNVI